MRAPAPDLDRSRPPRSGPPRPFRFPAFERIRLESGLQVLLYRNGAVPIAEMTLLVPGAGGDSNPVSRPGLASLTAALLDEGTRNRSGPELARMVERLGGSLASRADWNAARIEIDVLAEDLKLAVELSHEIFTSPTFPEQEVERLLRQARGELLRREDRPSVLADDLVTAELFPDTPLAFPLLGTRDSLERLDRTLAADFFERHYRTRGASLLLGGDLELEDCKKLLADVFGTWREAANPGAGKEYAARRFPTRRILVLDRPAAPQTELRVAHGAPLRSDPRWPGLVLLSSLLGGKFMSRLNLNLRERHGFTYGASSRFVEWRSAGLFIVSTAVANEVVAAAAREIFSELALLREEPVAVEELEESRNYLLGVFPFSLRTTSGVLARLEELALFDLPDDAHDRWLESIRSTTVEDLLELARLSLEPEHALLVAVGPAEQIARTLEPLGAVEVRSPAG